MKYECEGQISLFELMEKTVDKTSTLPCDTCGYYKKVVALIQKHLMIIALMEIRRCL